MVVGLWACSLCECSFLHFCVASEFPSCALCCQRVRCCTQTKQRRNQVITSDKVTIISFGEKYLISCAFVLRFARRCFKAWNIYVWLCRKRIKWMKTKEWLVYDRGKEKVELTVGQFQSVFYSRTPWEALATKLRIRLRQRLKSSRISTQSPRISFVLEILQFYCILWVEWASKTWILQSTRQPENIEVSVAPLSFVWWLLWQSITFHLK